MPTIYIFLTNNVKVLAYDRTTKEYLCSEKENLYLLDLVKAQQLFSLQWQPKKMRKTMRRNLSICRHQ